MPLPLPLISFSIVLAVVTTAAIAKRGGVRNGLTLMAAGFLLLAYGPAISIATHQAFYTGISLQNIAGPMIGFAAAMVGILAGHLAVPQRMDQQPAARKHQYLLLPALLLSTSSYGLFVFITRLDAGRIQGKLEQVQAAGGTAHYRYLIAQMIATSCIFLCRTTLEKRLWLFNLFVYVAYSLATSERDFLFVIAAVLVHREVFVNKRRSIRGVMLAAGAVIAGTTLAIGRQAVASGSIVNAILNQGSILFVDSQLYARVPDPVQHEWGRSYVEAILRPFGLSNADHLSDWFLSIYAPGSTSGYGFSLTGEAFLNFGTFGIAVVFFLLACTHRVLMNRMGRSDFACFVSVIFLATWLYSLRSDFSQIVSTLVDGAAVFAILRLSRVERPHHGLFLPEVGVRESAADQQHA